MNKVLFVAHVDSHIQHFHLPYLQYFKEKGYEVHVATSNDENMVFPNCDVKHTITMERNPLKLNNLKAIKEMKQLILKEKFDIIHCHTPMGGVVTRIAARKARKDGTKVLYTAHGFHFFKGASKLNWCIYYPIEKMLSKYTDVLITMNHEDYNIAKNKFHAKETRFIHGVGVNSNKFNNNPLLKDEENKLKLQLGIQKNDFCIIYVAELIKRKNQILLLEAMKDISEKNPHIKVFLVGKGLLEKFYREKIQEYHLQDKVIMLGYRKDVNQLLKVMDICVATSLQEGLPVNVVEAELSGLPVLAKNSRGHNELIQNNVNGFLFDSKEELEERILQLFSNEELLYKLKNNARNSVKAYTLENAFQDQVNIYQDVLQDT